MPQPLSICHVDPEPGFSGGEVQLFLLMEGLRNAGHRNRVACRSGSPIEHEARARGFETSPIGMRSDLALASALSLGRELRRRRVDLAHLHTGRATWLGALAARWAGVPAVSTRRLDRPVKPGPRTRWVYGALLREVAAISGPVAECLREGGVPPAKITVIHSSVDPGSLVPCASDSAVRAELGLAAGRPLILTLASIVHRKGIDVLLEALARMRHDAFLCVAGDEPPSARGRTLAALRRLTRELGLEPRVRFLGRREDRADLLAAATVFVLPSRREGLGVAALEAMAMGRAVVATRVGGLAEAVVDGETGLLVPPEDPDALALALDRALSDEPLRRRLEAGGPRRIERHYLARTMVAAYLELYERALARDEGSRPRQRP